MNHGLPKDCEHTLSLSYLETGCILPFQSLANFPKVRSNLSWPVQSQEQEVFSRSPTWVLGPKNLGHAPLVFQAISRELELEVEQPGYEVVPIWGAGADRRRICMLYHFARS